jgi:hypothetical protein
VTDTELRDGLAELRATLDALDQRGGSTQQAVEELRLLGLAVDNLRNNLWAILTARYTKDYEGFLARIRVRRASETCEDVLADLYAETITPNMPGLDVFHATLREIDVIAREVAS